MAQTQSVPTIFCGSNLDAPVRHLLPAGEAVIYTHRSPDKETANEDSAAILSLGDRRHVLTVADGMGGNRNGEAASRIAIEAMQASVCAATLEGLALRSGILSGIEIATIRIKQDAPGGGTTIVALEVDGDTVRPYHVGDSVILIVGQRGKVKLITTSHSPVGLAVEAGVLDDEEAMHHEERHMILNFVGSSKMRIEMGSTLHLARRDTVLLASDGLVDNLTIPEIVEFIRKGPLRTGVARAVNLATKRMLNPTGDQPSKPDDITLLAYRRR